MALGKMLGVFDLFTPLEPVVLFEDREQAINFAQQGFLSIIAKQVKETPKEIKTL